MVGRGIRFTLTGILTVAASMVSIGTAKAATVSAADIGSTIGISYVCDAGDPCPDAGNVPLVDLSATADFTLTGFSDDGTNTSVAFDVVISNTSSDGSSRISSFGFATSPDGTLGSVTDGNADGVDWGGGSGFIPGFSTVELCLWTHSSCTSAGGGATNGVQAGTSDSLSFIITLAGVHSDMTIDSHAIKFASVEGSGGGSYEFGGEEECTDPDGCDGDTSVVPLPAGMPLVLSALGMLAIIRRRAQISA